MFFVFILEHSFGKAPSATSKWFNSSSLPALFVSFPLYLNWELYFYFSPSLSLELYEQHLTSPSFLFCSSFSHQSPHTQLTHLCLALLYRWLNTTMNFTALSQVVLPLAPPITEERERRILYSIVLMHSPSIFSSMDAIQAFNSFLSTAPPSKKAKKDSAGKALTLSALISRFESHPLFQKLTKKEEEDDDDDDDDSINEFEISPLVTHSFLSLPLHCTDHLVFLIQNNRISYHQEEKDETSDYIFHSIILDQILETVFYFSFFILFLSLFYSIWIKGSF